MEWEDQIKTVCLCNNPLLLYCLWSQPRSSPASYQLPRQSFWNHKYKPLPLEFLSSTDMCKISYNNKQTKPQFTDVPQASNRCCSPFSKNRNFLKEFLVESKHKSPFQSLNSNRVFVVRFCPSACTSASLGLYLWWEIHYR